MVSSSTSVTLTYRTGVVGVRAREVCVIGLKSELTL
jgi:hypothetical protein